MPRGTIKTVGTMLPPSKGPAEGAPYANPGNKGTFHMTGTALPLSRTPTQQSPSANPKEGVRQDAMASKEPMTRTPVKSINDLDQQGLRFSDRAIKQSETV